MRYIRARPFLLCRSFNRWTFRSFNRWTFKRLCHGNVIYLCICSRFCTIVLLLCMENYLQINHHEFQLLVCIACTVGFFAFAGLVYFVDQLTTKKK